MEPGQIERKTRKGIPNHPLEFRRQLAAAACEPGVSVSGLARTHGINANQLFKWRRLYRSGELGGIAAAMTVLLPVERDRVESGPTGVPARSESGTIEIEIAGVTIRLRDGVNAKHLETVLHCLGAKS